MASKSQFIDLNKANEPRKRLVQKRNNDGHKAYRNSLEFPMEAYQGYPLVHEDIPHSYRVKHPSWKMNNYASETSMKMLVDDELSNRSNNNHNAPGIFAHLMGMDTLLSNPKPGICSKNCKDERLGNSMPRKEQIQISSTPFKPAKEELLLFGLERDSSKQTRSLRLTKPQPREHPQEELLQKFKKEFEEWQGSNVWKRSRTLGLDNSIVRQVKANRIPSQENLNKEKMARYLDSKRNPAENTEGRYYVSTTKHKIALRQGASLRNEQHTCKHSQHIKNEAMLSKNREKNNDLVHLSFDRFDKKLDRSYSAARIVILKPNSEEVNVEGPLDRSSKIPEKNRSMEDFIEEVKERLRFEIQGKGTATGIRTNTSLSKRSTDPKQIARRIAKQIRENVTRDLGTMLVRSESNSSHISEVHSQPTSSHRSEFQFNKPNPLESRDMRKLFRERPRNVLKNERGVNSHLITDFRSETPMCMLEAIKLKPRNDFSEMESKVNYWEDKKMLPIITKTRSHGGEKSNGVAFDAKTASRKDRVGSFCSPRKRFLEDHHVLTGDHIRSRSEVIKDQGNGFDPNDRVSCVRQNFSLTEKFNRKKDRPVSKSDLNELDRMKSVVTAPIVVMDFGNEQDNFTEVPPSPASVSSNSFDEFCRTGHPSPDSPFGVAFINDHHSPPDSEEFRTDIPELKSSSEQAEEDDRSEEDTRKVGEPHRGETAEVGEILLAANLYDNETFDQSFSRSDALSSISKWAFEKVEEACGRNVNLGQGRPDLLDNKMLSDMVNEALPIVIGDSRARSVKKELVPVINTTQVLNGLFCEIRLFMNPKVDESHSLHSMLAWDLRIGRWLIKPNEYIGAMGKEMEHVILSELINELVNEL